MDLHDTRGFYPTGVPPWRLGDNSLESATRRFIDVVVYDSSGRLAALIESEDDIGDIALPEWLPRRYAVRSVARDATGKYFDSYRSIERIAVGALAAQYEASDARILLAHLEAIQSNTADDHNPKRIPLFLTLARGANWRRTREKLLLIKSRLSSLSCRIIAV